MTIIWQGLRAGRGIKDISHVEEGHDVTFSSAMPDFKEMVSQIGILVKLYDLVKSTA